MTLLSFPARSWIAFNVLYVLALSTDAAAERSRPNVLFIAVDDLANTLGCCGDVIARTPHIDRLAAGRVCCSNEPTINFRFVIQLERPS